MGNVRVGFGWAGISEINSGLWLWVPAPRAQLRTRRGRREISSWHRKAQGIAAAGHVDGGKAGRCKAAAAAVTLLIGLELALARAKRGSAAPVQRLVLELDGAVFGVDGFRKTENLLRRADDVGMQAFAGIDAIPAAADHGLAVVGRDRGHDLVPRVVAPGEPGGRG